MLRYRPDLKGISRKLRSNQTDAEQCLWSRLRRKQLRGVQFYRQRPVERYILDFLAPSAMLAVEVDGSQHSEERNLVRDEARDEALKLLGIAVLRFDNRQVLTETDAVVAVIDAVLTERLANRKSPPAPLFQRGENGPTSSPPSTPLLKEGENGPLSSPALTPALTPLCKGGQGGFREKEE